MAKYTCEEKAGVYSFTWEVERVRIVADRVKTHFDRTVCGLEITTTAPGIRPKLYSGQLNVLAVRSRTELGRTLEDRYPLSASQDPGAGSWDSILEDFCAEIRDRLRTGDPFDELPADGGTAVPYLVPGLVPLNQPSLFFGAGGSLKSLVVLWLGLLIQNGLTPPWAKVPLERKNVGYLDWETDRKEMARRCRLLREGMQLDGLEGLRNPYYKACRGPFSDILPDIARDVGAKKLEVLIVDSLGVACGGEIEKSEVALGFFEDLRKLSPITSILVTHLSKAEKSRQKGSRMPIGSIYFENIPRMIWEVKTKAERGEPQTIVGLFCRKSNVSGLLPDIGLGVLFEPEFISVEDSGVSAEFGEEISQLQSLLRLLAEGPRDRKQVSEFLEVGLQQASTLLYRAYGRGLTVKLPGRMWGLKTAGVPDSTV